MKNFEMSNFTRSYDIYYVTNWDYVYNAPISLNL